MKKKTLTLLGTAALVGVALASCSKKNSSDPEDDNYDTTEYDLRVADAYYSGSDNSSGVVHWTPKTLSEVQSSYHTSGEIDAWIVYSKSYGTTYNGVLGDDKDIIIDRFRSGVYQPAPVSTDKAIQFNAVILDRIINFP